MPDAFVPLAAPAASVPPAHSAGGLSSQPPSPAPGALPFQPLTFGPGSAPGGAACAPKISLEREGDRVTRISVFCTCGQVTVLDCGY
jgi:hypothetical protein